MKKRSGFSIIEVMCVLITFIALSAGVFVLSESTQRVGTYHSDKVLTATVASAVSQYKFETGNYPASLNNLTTKSPDNKGPWLTGSFLDSYNQQLVYRYYASEKMFKVYSKGANKADNSNSSDASLGGDDIGVVIRQ